MKKNMFMLVFMAALIVTAAACSKDQSANTNGATTATTQGSISILAPRDGAVLNSGAANKLEYNVHLSPTGNHLHVYIDDQKPIVDRDVSHCPCSLDLPALASGKHVIAVKEATSAHVLTGVQSTVSFTVK